MALVTETTSFSGYSPTATPVLDVLRPAPNARSWKLTSGEYFLLSGVLITSLIGLPTLHSAVAESEPSRFLLLLLSPILAFLAAVLVHEVGHLCGAALAGFKFSAGSEFEADVQQNLYGSKLLKFLRLHPNRTNHLERRLIALYVAGPLAGLAYATALEFSHDWAQANVQIQLRVHMFSAFALLVSLAALLPDVTRSGNFSDGARLVMLFKRDARAKRLKAVLEMEQSLRKGTHPKQWSEELVFGAIAVDDGSRDQLAAHWLAYLWACERQDITSATHYLEDTLNAPASCAAGLRNRLFLEAAVFQAWFRDNPLKARSWVELIDARKLTSLEQQRLAIAALWSDGKLFDAFEKLSAYLHALEAMPALPSRHLAQTNALEWKRQMESRMLTRAWRAMYTISQQVESSTKEKGLSVAGAQLSSC